MEEENSNSPVMDPIEEVRKLQDLVRRLELQNQQLRNKQAEHDSDEVVNTLNGSDDTKLSKTVAQSRTEGSDSESSRNVKREARKSIQLDDVGLINIEDIDVAEEDSWLYRSPKGVSLEDQSVNPSKWLRKDVDDPSNKELQLARRALAYKLDELAILNPFNKPQNIFGPSEHVLHSKPPLGRIIDSRTFTRGKKKRSPYDDSHTLAIMESIGAEYEEDSQVAHSGGSATSSSPTPRVPPVTDVIDVQEIARMQEESLRQSSPSSTPKRSQMGRWPSSLKNSMSDSEDSKDPASPVSSENFSKSRFNNSAATHYQESFSNSAHSSPPESLNGSNNSLDKPNNDSFHHSLPNLTKGCNGVNSSRSRGQLSSNGGVPPPRSLALNLRLSSMSPARMDRRLGVPSRSVSNLRSASPRRSPPHHQSFQPHQGFQAHPGNHQGHHNGLSPSGPVAPQRVTSPSRPRLQPPSASASSPVKTTTSGLPVPKMSKIPSPKPSLKPKH